MSSELWIKRKPKVGDKITTRTWKWTTSRSSFPPPTLLDTKESLVNGVKVVFHEVESVNHKSGITTHLEIRRSRAISFPARWLACFEMRRESEEHAKNTEFSSDLFIAVSPSWTKASVKPST